MVWPIIFLISFNYPAEKVKPESKKDRINARKTQNSHLNLGRRKQFIVLLRKNYHDREAFSESK
jgi:hypothetical protein